MKKLLAIFITSIIVLGCKDRLTEKRNNGYQIFEDFGIAIKTPCQLQVDSSLLGRQGFEKAHIYVCPQIFSDTTRTGFRLGELLKTKGTVYHLRIWESDRTQDVEQSLNNQIQVFKEYGIDSFENITVDNRKALLYGPIQSSTYEAIIPVEWCTIYVGVSGDKKELEEILSEMVIEE